MSRPDSDIDVLVVRPDGADVDDSWPESLDQWRLELKQNAGLPVNLLESGESEWRSLDESDRSFWNEVQREQVVVLSRCRAES